MPAAIPFAFSDTMMPSASTAAPAGAAMTEGASFFGQLVEAAALPEALLDADKALPAVPPRGAMVGEWPAAGAGSGSAAFGLGEPLLDATGADEDAAAAMLGPDMADVADGSAAIGADLPATERDVSAEPVLRDREIQPALLDPEQSDATPYTGSDKDTDTDTPSTAPESSDDASVSAGLHADRETKLRSAQDAALEAPDLLVQQAAADESFPALTPLAAAMAAKAQNAVQNGNSTSADAEQAAAAATGVAANVNAAAFAPDRADLAEAAKLADAKEADGPHAPSNGKESAQAPALAATASTKPAAIEATMPAALLTQAMAPIGQAPVGNGAHPYAAALAAVSPEPVVKAEAGRFGADVGLEIAKVAKGEGDSLLIRLDPRDMGRVDVRLSFDRDGILRAVMSVDSPAALDMLRRESGELHRALTDAGVKSDGQSLRFDARSDGGTGQGGPQSGSQGQNARSGNGMGASGHGEPSAADYQPLRTTTQVDLIA